MLALCGCDTDFLDETSILRNLKACRGGKEGKNEKLSNQ
jgi:hypothetical protein